MTTRRHFMAAALLMASVTAAATDDKQIYWAELIPKDWDPRASFRDLQNLGTMADTDPRTQQVYERMREVWDNAPTVTAMAGRTVKLRGYVVPLEFAEKGMREFLLVPYFGACIHTPPPPANQIVHVRLSSADKGLRSMDAVWARGTLGLQRADSGMGVSGYTMNSASVRKSAK